MIKRKKRGQEEMVGFALIVIIVTIILVVFLAIFLKNPGKEPVESYKVEGFINALLQYNTECKDNFGLINIKELIYDCYEEKKCKNGDNSCDILETTLQGLIDSSWHGSQDSPVKGYVLNISINEVIEHSFEQGNQTNNAWGYSESLPKNVEVVFVVYY